MQKRGQHLYYNPILTTLSVIEMSQCMQSNLDGLREKYGLYVDYTDGLCSITPTNVKPYPVYETMTVIGYLNDLITLQNPVMHLFSVDQTTLHTLINKCIGIRVSKGSICHAMMLMRFPLSTELKRPEFRIPFAALIELSLRSYKFPCPMIRDDTPALTMDAIHALCTLSGKKDK